MLFGPNSAGKSTILQALVYLREILERRNLDPDKTILGGESLDLGGFKSLIHGHNMGHWMKLGFSISVDGAQLPDFLSSGDQDLHEHGSPIPVEEYIEQIDSATVEICLQWSVLDQRVIINKVSVSINDEILAVISASSGSRRVQLDRFRLEHSLFNRRADEESELDNALLAMLEGVVKHDHLTPSSYLDDELGDGEHETELLNIQLRQEFHALPHLNEPLPLEWNSVWDMDRGNAWQEHVRVASCFDKLASRLIVGPIQLMAEELQRMLYIGPIREVPARNLTTAKSPDPGGWSRGNAAWNLLLNRGGQLVDDTNKWIADKERLNTGYRVEVSRYYELPREHPLAISLQQDNVLDEESTSAELGQLRSETRLSLRDVASDLEVSPQDVGVGISQLLPVVVAALSRSGGIIAIEQPELHIHPALQVELGDLFASRLAEFSGVYLLESHSEHFILRLLRRIRETAAGELPPGAPRLTPEDVAVHYIQPGAHGTMIKRLRIDESGDFVDEWPRGFFDERDEELFF